VISGVTSPIHGHGAKFTRKQDEAIVALLSQRTVDEAARVTGIGVKTLHRWLQIPEFRDAYREARRHAVGQATARLQQASSAAVSVLLTVMLDGNAPHASRIRAAHTVLEMSVRAIELEDIEARVAALEERTAERRP
jgi:hypothetical protein